MTSESDGRRQFLRVLINCVLRARTRGEIPVGSGRPKFIREMARNAPRHVDTKIHRRKPKAKRSTGSTIPVCRCARRLTRPPIDSRPVVRSRNGLSVIANVAINEARTNIRAAFVLLTVAPDANDKQNMAIKAKTMALETTKGTEL